MNSCSCLTLIVACIIYWQAREISRTIRRCDPSTKGLKHAMLRHSPSACSVFVAGTADNPTART